MTENIYKGFGSHIVIDPQDPGLSDSDKNNDVDSGSRWHNVKVQLRYFTIRAHPEDVKKNIRTNNKKGDKSGEDPAEKENSINNVRLSVHEANSFDSFHSCHSLASYKDLYIPSREHDRKNRHRYSRNKSSEEEFHDQITMINAIFLNKKVPKGIHFEIKNDNVFNKIHASDSTITDTICSFNSDQSPGDRMLVPPCENCKCSLQQKHRENIRTPPNRKEAQQKNTGLERPKLSHEKLSDNKPVIKTFKMKRKQMTSKVTGRKFYHTTQHNTQLLKEFQVKSPRENMPCDETYDSPQDELYKGVLLLIRQGISEGYEIHFLEPIEQTNYSNEFCSGNNLENVNNNVVHRDEKLSFENKNCEMVSSFDDFTESFLTLFNRLQSSDPGVRSSEDTIEIEPFVDSGIKSSRNEMTIETEPIVYSGIKSSKNEVTIETEPIVFSGMKGSRDEITIEIDPNVDSYIKSSRNGITIENEPIVDCGIKGSRDEITIKTKPIVYCGIKGSRNEITIETEPIGDCGIKDSRDELTIKTDPIVDSGIKSSRNEITTETEHIFDAGINISRNETSIDSEPNVDSGIFNSRNEITIETEPIVDSDIKGQSDEITRTPDLESDFYFESNKDQDYLYGSDEGDFTILYQSETKYSDVSLSETFETLFKTESQLNKTDNQYVNPVSSNETTNEGIEADEENNKVIYTQSKRKPPPTRKSFLPVIEEKPEPTQETFRSDLDNDYCLVDNFGRSIHLFDSRGFPLTDGSGRPLRTAGGQLLLKCDDNGIPVVDEETHIFDMFGMEPHEEGFQPWKFPRRSRANRLMLRNGRPLVLYDVEGKPLTSISGTMLVDRCGRSLLKLSGYPSFNC